MGTPDPGRVRPHPPKALRRPSPTSPPSCVFWNFPCVSFVFLFCFCIRGQLASSCLTLRLLEPLSCGHSLAALPVSLLPRSQGLGKASVAHGWGQVALMVPGVCRERWCRVWVLPRPTHHKQVQGGGVARRLDGSSSGPGTQFHAPPPRQASGSRWFQTGPRAAREPPHVRVLTPVPSPAITCVTTSGTSEVYDSGNNKIFKAGGRRGSSLACWSSPRERAAATRRGQPPAFARSVCNARTS